ALISVEDILANEGADDKDGDGISGRANWVYSKLTKKTELGKYTWKASDAFLKEHIANAASNEIGLATSVNPSENCTD
ncbi:di-heme oxidoredictase family protein, partial [Aliarcobacter butzleri]|uniref:di-heme oxidoredictase family protein n=1 Tax=Aliarcobacter butzleri TaxID=28197 RepID=UPI003AF856B9